jgi:PknH-like extracellular domain
LIIKALLAQPYWMVAALLAVAVTGCGTAHDDRPAATPVTTNTTSSIAPTPSSNASMPAGVRPGDLPGLLIDLDGLKNILNAPTLVKMSTWRHLDTSFGVSIDPPQCAPVIASGLATTFGGSGQRGVFYVNYTAVKPPPLQVSQGLVAFPDAPSAQTFFTKQQALWQQCSNSDVTVNQPDGPIKQTFGQAQTTAGVLSVIITATQGFRCARTMAIKTNVITDNLVCSTALADQATTIANAILAKVH